MEVMRAVGGDGVIVEGPGRKIVFSLSVIRKKKVVLKESKEGYGR